MQYTKRSPQSPGATKLQTQLPNLPPLQTVSAKRKTNNPHTTCLSVNPLIQQWLAADIDRQLTPASLASRAWAMRSFENICPHLEKATYTDLQEFVRQARTKGLPRSDGRTPHPLTESSLRQVLSMISTFYHFHMERGTLPTHPFPRRRHLLRRSKALQTRRRALRLDDIRALATSCTTPLETALLTLLSKTALRIQEASNLQTTDINWRTGRTRLRNRQADGTPLRDGTYPKRTNHTIWLDSETLTALRPVRGEWAIQGPHGRINREMARHILRDLSLRANLVTLADAQDRRENITPHVLRHAWTSIMTDRGMREAHLLDYRGDLRRRHTADQYLTIAGEDLRREYLRTIFSLESPDPGHRD